MQDYGSSGVGEAIIETPDTCYVIAGRQGTSSSNVTYDMRLVKTDINGDTYGKDTLEALMRTVPIMCFFVRIMDF
ncbi:MAG: hypothetical protein R2759_11040 [Bacteroidales bacterium]